VSVIPRDTPSLRSSPREKVLVVASYNIHRGVGLDRRRDLDRIADVIEEMRPDVVGLQEVIRTAGAPQADQAGYLAQRLRMDLVMGVTRELEGGTYGNVVLTRLPILGSATHDLSHGRRERRGAVRVDLATESTTVHVFNCHFGLTFRERRRQLDLLGAFMGLSGGLSGPRVLVGDFNEWHLGPITRRLRREFTSPMHRLRRTHPAAFPIFALDRIYWDVDLEGEDLRVHRSRLARVASDHLPLVARLRLRRRPPPRGSAYVVGEALPPAE
jgi:endonuclease/exonuclease/phosphatase family metal-dependent hydrolase